MGIPRSGVKLVVACRGISPVRVAVSRPGSRLAVWSGNGSGRSPASKTMVYEDLVGGGSAVVALAKPSASLTSIHRRPVPTGQVTLVLE